MVMPEVLPMVSSPEVTNRAAKLIMAAGWKVSWNCIGRGRPNQAASAMGAVSTMPRTAARM